MIHFATFGRRVWAFWLSLIVDLIMLALLTLVTSGNAATPFAFWYFLHHVGFVAEGGTIGHRLAGLRVVATDGTSLSWGRAILRELVRLFMSFPPLGLGVLWMLDEPQRRTWHDLLGGTVVVRETAVQEAAQPTWAAAPPWVTQAVTGAATELDAASLPPSSSSSNTGP